MPNLRHLTNQAGHACRGGSLLETLLVLVLVAVLVLVSLDRFMVVRVEAERVAMEAVVQALRFAVLERALHGRASGERRNASELQGSNPMVWLARPPMNYLGELAGPDPAAIPGGQWYFDSASQLLVYRVDYEAYFDSPLPGAARARFKLGIDSADTDRDEHSETGMDEVRGLAVGAVEPYIWRRHPVSLSALRIWGVLGTSP
jgi:type II secretory pathway pseudopilin PulG